MGNSLQDQLLKAGLVDEKKAKKAKAGKPPKKRKKGQQAELSESARAAREAQAQKAARDRELEQQRKADAERKAARAQVRQLVEQHRLDRDGAELDYHFTDGGKVARIAVTGAQQAQLVKGRLDIVRAGTGYELVPADIAARIAERDAACVMPRNASDDDPDDPYADYKVPDDLMW